MRVAVIPARGGSKRIPHKNIKLFAGQPVIVYSIRAALQSGLFDTVIVSTDDEAIADVAIKQGASVPFMRPADLADDFTGTNAVVKHAIAWLHANHGTVDQACCIYATAPFLQAETLRAGYSLLIEGQSQFVFAVTSFPFPVQRALHRDGAGHVTPLFPEYATSRSQDLTHAFHDAGQFYWGQASAFLDEAVLYSAVSKVIELPRYLVQDIDTFEDWERAELMYYAWHANRDPAACG